MHVYNVAIMAAIRATMPVVAFRVCHVWNHAGTDHGTRHGADS